ncbi:MAG: AAA family ATPase [Lachnospiraceae bacterium]|nr:AAA family ATPase [Lachnospiraceae bacterium]
MKINSLYLTHFGCFHQKRMELQSGINVIYGENEAGKSTIHHFIGAMLFGVERLRGKGSKKDEYSRYKPWEQGKNYEGSMEITHEGRVYRLIRNFYREDEYFKIEQLDTGKQLFLTNGQLDTLIGGLNKTNFKNTLSISQMETQIDATFGLTLQAYMANIEQTKSQAVDLSATIDYLKKEKKKYQHTEAEKQLKKLQEQSDTMRVFDVEREQIIEEITRRQEMLDQVRTEIKSHNLADKESRRIEQKERMEAIRLIEENNRIAAEYQQKKAAYDQLKAEMSEVDFEELKDQWAEASVDYEELADRYGQMKGRNLAIMFSVLMFGMIPVIAMFFLKGSMLFRMAAIGGLVILLFVLMILLGSGRKRMKRKVDAAREHFQEMQQAMEQNMFGRGNKAMLKQLKDELHLLRDQYEHIQVPLQPYLEKYGDDISLDVDDEEEDTVEFLREKEAKILKSLERLLVQKETFEQQDVELENLETEMSYLKQNVKDSQEEAEIIQECMDIILELSEEIHSDFGPALNREVSKLMQELTGGKYGHVVVDNELGLKVDTGNGFVSADQFSTGTKEQLYLVLRLAMINLLYPDKKMPIMFDDSFVYYDDGRLARILSWLSRQGYEQILIFTCQKREMVLMDRMGVEYHPIYL